MIKMQKFAIVIILKLLILSCILGCGDGPKQKIIPREDLYPILVDIHLAEGMYSVNTIVNEHALDKETLYNMVLDKHGYTKAEFDSAMSFYSKKRTKMLLKIYDDVMEELSRIEDETNNEGKKNR